MTSFACFISRDRAQPRREGRQASRIFFATARNPHRGNIPKGAATFQIWEIYDLRWDSLWRKQSSDCIRELIFKKYFNDLNFSLIILFGNNTSKTTLSIPKGQLSSFSPTSRALFGFCQRHVTGFVPRRILSSTRQNPKLMRHHRVLFFRGGTTQEPTTTTTSSRIFHGWSSHVSHGWKRSSSSSAL